MAIEVDTKDCTALSDAELAEMADLCADSSNAFEVGMLSKQAEAWVLCTVRERGWQDSGLLVLHPGAHRRYAECARRCRPHLSQHRRHGPAGDRHRSAAPFVLAFPTRTSWSAPR